MSGFSTGDDDEVSRSRHSSRYKLVVDLLKVCFQGFLVGFVITPFVTGKSGAHMFFAGVILCLFLIVFAWIIDGFRIKEEARWTL